MMIEQPELIQNYFKLNLTSTFFFFIIIIGKYEFDYEVKRIDVFIEVKAPC